MALAGFAGKAVVVLETGCSAMEVVHLALALRAVRLAESTEESQEAPSVDSVAGELARAVVTMGGTTLRSGSCRSMASWKAGPA